LGDGPSLHQFVPDPERGEAKVAGAADLQPAQPFEILSSSIETTKHVCCFVQDDQRGRKVFDVYRNDKRDMLVLSTGSAVPVLYSAHNWRNSRKRVLKVSDEIKSAVQDLQFSLTSRRHGASATLNATELALIDQVRSGDVLQLQRHDEPDVD
jgi:hypothetical protein